ncbi:hypothetical protein DV736_g1244, partial [Chaetothyriales sp. CBS 134916]
MIRPAPLPLVTLPPGAKFNSGLAASHNMAATVEAPATGLLNLEKDLICFICTEVLHRPLTLIDCLHTFCGSCLKEWFSHQHQKASRSHHPPTQPYTCPTCRDTVKDARRNAMINTLLESFLMANPGKNRTEEEKLEMDKLYKLGDDIMPKRGTRDTRATPPSANDSLAPSHTDHRSRSREHDERRDRRIHEREERRQRRERLEVPESSIRDSSRDDQSDGGPVLSSPVMSIRHPDAVAARRDARSVAHQASLRSIASISDLGTGTSDSLTEEQLMQEIISEGLLDGIDVENLTEAEQDILCEAIAERFRQRHPDHGHRPTSNTEQSPGQQPELPLDIQDLQIEEADRVPRPHRAHGSNPIRPGRGPRSTGQVNSRPPTANSGSELAHSSDSQTHQRRVSDQSGHRSSSQVRHHTHPTTRTAASSSSIELSGQPHVGESAVHDSPRQISGNQRANTELRTEVRASELSSPGTAHGRRVQINGPPQAASPPVPSPLLLNPSPRIDGAVEANIEPTQPVLAGLEPISLLPRPKSTNAHLALPAHSPAHSIGSSATSTTDVSRGPEPDFFNLNITTHCDVCTQPVPSGTRRFHCPTHPSPSSHDPNAAGDYDICTPCYHNLVKAGRIKREDGPAGWRKCLQGHRMIITTFEADSDSELRRVVAQDLVGGVKMQDEDIAAWTAAMTTQEGAVMTPTRVREWTWYDPADPAADPGSVSRHVKTRQSAFAPQSLGGTGTSNDSTATVTGSSTKSTKFPPDGGFGETCVALWSYYPEEGEAGKGELIFPRYAEIKEVEHINEDWSDGVYAGQRGLLPAAYVRELS